MKNAEAFDLLEEILHTVRFTRHYTEVVRDMLDEQESKEPRHGVGNLGTLRVLAELLAHLEENVDSLGYLLEEWKPKRPPEDAGGLRGRTGTVSLPYGSVKGKFLTFCTLPHSNLRLTPPPGVLYEREDGTVTWCALKDFRFTTD